MKLHSEREDEQIFERWLQQGCKDGYKAVMYVLPHITERSAKKRWSEVHSNKELCERYDARLRKQRSRAVMDITERQEALSEIARDKRYKTSDRISAIKVLNDMDSIGTKKIEVTIDDKRKMISEKMDVLLGMCEEGEDGNFTVSVV